MNKMKTERKCQTCGLTILPPKRYFCTACRRLRKNAYTNRYYYDHQERELEKSRVYEKSLARKESLVRRWHQLKNNAKAKERTITISQEEFNILTSSPCHYCKDYLCQARTGTRIDRLDNSKDYVLGNCVPCCATCNAIKQDLFNEEEAMVMIQALIELKKAQQTERGNC